MIPPMYFAKSALLTFTFALTLGVTSVSRPAITNVAATTLNNHNIGLNSDQSCSNAGDWCGFDFDGEVNEIFPCCDAFLTFSLTLLNAKESDVNGGWVRLKPKRWAKISCLIV
ncbi:hypothetical protein K438DRAFT_2177468 [Mycena galopus ATCC 62051]|nr:hypothetical protein K438DRAFT_2177468 [Mycena galopus ATCC 62051]